MSMSRVPWSTFARCRVRLAMVDIRPPIGVDGRYSTVDLSRPEIQEYMSNDDFSQSHLSSGPVARFAAPERIVSLTGPSVHAPSNFRFGEVKRARASRLMAASARHPPTIQALIWPSRSANACEHEDRTDP